MRRARGLALCLLLMLGGIASPAAAAERARWQKLAAVNGNGATTCNTSGDLYACLALRCGKGRGLEFAFLFNVGDYGNSPKGRISVDGHPVAELGFSAVDPKRELVAPFDQTGHAALIERMRSGRMLVLDIGFTHRFPLNNAKSEIDRTLAMCAGETGREKLAAGGDARQVQASRVSEETLRNALQQIISSYRPADSDYDYRDGPGQALVAEFLAPPPFGNADISTFELIEERKAQSTPADVDQLIGGATFMAPSGRFVASQDHRAALRGYQNSLKGGWRLEKQDEAKLTRRFEQVLQQTEARFGTQHPAVGFVLESMSRFHYARRQRGEPDPDSRVALARLYKTAAELLRNASPDIGRRRELLENVIHARLRFAQEARGDDTSTRCSLGIEEKDVYDAYREAAAVHHLLAGPAFEQIGWLQAAAACSDDMRQTVKLMAARLHLARRLNNQQAIARTLADLAMAQHLAGEKDNARMSYREVFRLHTTLAASRPDLAFIVPPSWGEDRRAPWQTLKALGLEDELDLYVARTIARLMREHGDWYMAGQSVLLAAVGVYDISDALEASRQTALADQFYAFPWCSYRIKGDQKVESPVACMSLYGQQRIDTGNHAAAIRVVNRALRIAEQEGDRPRVARVLSQLARAHDERGELDLGLAHARRALSMVKAGGIDPKPFPLTDLNRIITKAEQEQGRRDKVAQRLGDELHDGIVKVCEKGEAPNRFPAIPVETLLRDPIIAAEFFGHPAIRSYVECFNRQRHHLAGIARPWAPNLLDSAVSDVLFVLGSMNDKERATEILAFLFAEQSWLTSKSDRELLALLPSAYLKHLNLPPAKRVAEARIWQERGRLDAYAAAVRGLLLARRSEWLSPYLTSLTQFASDGFIRRHDAANGFLPTALALDLHAMGQQDLARRLHHVLRLEAQRPAADRRNRGWGLAESEFMGVMSETTGDRAAAEKHYADVPGAFIVMNSGANVSPDEAAALREQALAEGFLHEHAGRYGLAEVYYKTTGRIELLQKHTQLLDRLTDVQLAAAIIRLEYARGRKQRARAMSERMVAAARDKLHGKAAFSSDSIVRWSHRLRDVFETHLDSAPGEGNGRIAAGESDFFAIQYLQTTGAAATIARIAERASPHSGATVRKHQDLSRQLSSLFSELAVAKGKRVEALLPRIRELEKRKSAVEEALKAENPNFATQLGFRFLTLADVQRRLRAQEALLLSFSGREYAYLWLVTKDASVLRRLETPPTEIERKIVAVRQAVAAYLQNSGEERWQLGAFHAPYLAFVAPLEAQLQGINRLYFVPNGAFDGLPLSALLEREPPKDRMTSAEIRASKLPWLIRRFSINVLPSVQSIETLDVSAGAPRKQQRAFLGVGNPDFGKGLRIAALPARSVSESLIRISPLPETEAEIRKIAEIMHADPAEDLLLGARASEKAIKDTALSRYRIINFATHGVLAGQLAGIDEPALVLSIPPKSTPDDDGLLKASEIAALMLDADLVLLSACNTAASDGRPGAEGLSGLANAFFYAGARNLVVTHWEIPSTPAVEIATGMIEAYARSGRADWSRALQTSIVQMIDGKGPPDFAHPGAWGAHMVVGTATSP